MHIFHLLYFRSLSEDTLHGGESESSSNANGNSSTSNTVTTNHPADLIGNRSLSLRGSRSLLPISPSVVEDPELGTSRLDQEPGI